MSDSIRPPFLSLPCNLDDEYNALTSQNSSWIPVCWCDVGFSAAMFEAAVKQLIHHPEYNSTLILRSEIIDEAQSLSSGRPLKIHGYREVRSIHRRLLPRRPGRDPPIDQHCTFYVVETEEHDTDDSAATCLVLSPMLEPGSSMPYYHPAVHHLAFRFFPSTEPVGNNSRLRIEIVPTVDAPDPKDVNSRLYRTCMALLEAVHRYGWGIASNYQKQSFHDCVVAREEYQDLYLVLRERHKHLVEQWHENTDPLKHVFEDIGIATFLILLWKQDVYAGVPQPVASNNSIGDGSVPWHRWPRPPGGFLDFGCGNGLLVHILVSEGYSGVGIDLRARTSWEHYPPTTQDRLHVHALNPLNIDFEDTDSLAQNYIKPGTFIIANHADELSPWTPVLATLSHASGFLSIPCCPWSFDARFHRSQLPLKVGSDLNPFGLALMDVVSPGTSPEEFIASLRLGGLAGEAGKSAYATYRVWLAALGVRCGWEAETETLRIPSTRNWSLVGRRRCDLDELGSRFALNIVSEVRSREIFQTRKPEGKAREH